MTNCPWENTEANQGSARPPENPRQPAGEAPLRSPTLLSLSSTLKCLCFFLPAPMSTTFLQPSLGTSKANPGSLWSHWIQSGQRLDRTRYHQTGVPSFLGLTKQSVMGDLSLPLPVLQVTTLLQWAWPWGTCPSKIELI